MDKMDYSSFYITQALFKLMEKEDYSSINISDISKKAGVGRATFYRHFKTKEDIIISFFKDKTKEFVKGLIYKPRSDEDYQDMITKAFDTLYE
ncbi:MAG: TetR/AcrR family transcriptional regulator, partial [Bacilli bacterium]